MNNQLHVSLTKTARSTWFPITRLHRGVIWLSLPR